MDQKPKCSQSQFITHGACCIETIFICCFVPDQKCSDFFLSLLEIIKIIKKKKVYISGTSSVTPGHVLILFIINKCKCHPCGIHLKSKSIYFTLFKVNNNLKKFVCVPYFFFFSPHAIVLFTPTKSFYPEAQISFSLYCTCEMVGEFEKR